MERAPVRAPLIKNLQFKVGLLLSLTVLLALGLVFYGLYARGLFEPTQTLNLTAPDAEGVSVGMPVSFSGFPIGEVKKMDLSEDGKVLIEVAIPKRDAKWLRHNSQFTLEKGLIGSARIKAHTADLRERPLVDGATLPLLTGEDPTDIAVIKQRVQTLLDNVVAMTQAEAPINRTLGHVETMTGRMAGEYGVLGGVMGSPEKARQVVKIIEQANTLMGNVNGISLKVDGMLAKADTQVFGPDGVMDHTRQSVATVNRMLGEVRESLKKADAILASAQTASADVAVITGNVKEATTDMAQLRVEIDDSVRKVNHLINEINKKWPFARDVEIRTP
ncbi:MAG TPA: MlaD family protein [Thiobacillaceae bacterium]|nr:MlaD family protein [Thiobacillaceae bacterium]HNU62924.1 MlaD family protein [Thiobacillaceae bacterium]